MIDRFLLQTSPLDDPSTKWALIAFAVAAIAYFTLIRPLRKKKDPLERAPVPSTFAQQRAVERDMSNLLVELSEMSRQMTAQLDTRAAKLELLLKEADDKIALLQALPRAQPMAQSALQPTDGPPAPLLEPPAPGPAVVDPRHVQVYELADQGRSPRQIAHELGRPNGEIELILALRGE